MTQEKSEKTQRVIALLNREEIDFLDKLGKDTLFSSGVKFPRTKIIQNLIEVLKKADINVKDITSDSQLQKKIIDAVKHINI